jgi:anti-anti-sigma factor
LNEHPLTATVDHRPDGVLIRLAGEANVHAVRQINDAFHPVVEAAPKLVVLDLAGVPVMGSLAMGALLTLRKALQRSGGELYVAAASPLVLDAFTRARLVEVLNLRGTVEAAFADGTAPQPLIAKGEPGAQ